MPSPSALRTPGPWPSTAHRLGVFTVAEAARCGVSRDSLERAVASGRLQRLRRGVYGRPVGASDHPAESARLERTRSAVAAAVVTRGAVVSHLPAAGVLGWPVWAPRERACLTLPPGTRTHVAGLHLHRAPLGAAALWRVDGLTVTDPARTVVDIACEFGTEAGLVVADAAAAAGALTTDLLRTEIDRCAGRRGIGHAVLLPELVDPLAESVLESRSRWQMVVHRVPPPRSQVPITDERGRFLGRADFYWEEGVVGEVDGEIKYLVDGSPTLLQEKRRQAGFERLGLRCVRWGRRDLTAFGPVAEWIDDARRLAAADPRPRRWVVR